MDVDKKMDTLENNYKVAEEAAKLLSVHHQRTITDRDVLRALFLVWCDKYECEWPGDLWDVLFVLGEVVEALKQFDFSTFETIVETDKAYYGNLSLFERKARVKHNNVVWLIHRYDADPFPSNPHAHDEDQNLKLDLSNGKCYQVRRFTHQISKKQLLAIRQKAAQVFKGELPALAIK